MPAQPAAALDANYWRGGSRTPLGDEPHIYEFVIRGNEVTGVSRLKQSLGRGIALRPMRNSITSGST